jgi:hypothetical protein
MYDATGFSDTSTNAGSNGTYNEEEGMAGTDIIIGNGNTRIAFYNATAGVTVDLAAPGANGQTGTASGDGSVGSDIIKGGVNAMAGSQFDDSFRGTNNATGSESFDGRAGNDLFTGNGGLDQAIYNNDASVTVGISIDMAAGKVIGETPLDHTPINGVSAG